MWKTMALSRSNPAHRKTPAGTAARLSRPVMISAVTSAPPFTDA